MKKIIFMVLFLSASSICSAQIDSTEVVDEVNQNVLVATQIPQNSAFQPNFILKNGKLKLLHSFRFGIIISKDGIMAPDFSGFSEGDAEDNTEKSKQGSGLGVNLAYRVSFFPGKTDNKRNFNVNPLGFGYSFGVDISGNFQENYGLTCDVFAAAGFELGGPRVGFGIDGLIGTGNINGFMIQEHNSNPELSMMYKESKMSFKAGGQIWMKIAFSPMGFMTNQVTNGKDMRIFIRYIHNTVPQEQSVDEFSIFPMFSNQSFQLGVSFSF